MARALLSAAIVVATVACHSPAAPTATMLTIACASTTFIRTGETTPCTATATIADGTMRDETAAAEWSSSAPGVASVSNRGVVTSVAPGSTVISASFQALRASQTITVFFPPPS